MNDVSFDALTRRPSLMALGAPGLSGFAGSLKAAGNLKAAGKKKKNKKSDDKKCKKQAGQCSTFLLAACAGEPSCLVGVPCCSFFSKCNTTGFLTCLANSIPG